MFNERQLASYLPILILLASCSEEESAPPVSNVTGTAKAQVDDQKYMAKSIESALAALELVPLNGDEFEVIEEPPGVYRGITGRTPAGDEVWIYTTRSEYRTELEREVTWKDLKDLSVGGIARRVAGKWATTGDVVSYYHVNR